MTSEKTVQMKTVLKTIEAVCFAIGPAITAYYLFNFTVDNSGYYYKDMEFGIAVGVFLMSLGFAVKHWRQ